MINLVYWMAKTGMTTAKLVEESGVDKNTITDLKKGRRNPNPVTIGKLAKAFGCDVGELLGQAEQVNT
jgi:transcriptional regulator with XRE-family HTH domain